MTSSGTAPGRPKRATYEIVVRGELSERFAATFLSERVGSWQERPHVESGDGTTALVVEVIDQAHLLAILGRLRDLSLEIERVNPAHENERNAG